MEGTMVEPTFPDKLDVLLHGGGPLFSISIADLGDKGLLQACRERDPGLSDQAWFELSGDGGQISADLFSPAAAALGALPCKPKALVFSTTSASTSEPLPEANGTLAGSRPSQFPSGNKIRQVWSKVCKRLGNVVITGIKVVIVLEAAAFIMERTQALRNRRPRDRRGLSSDLASEESDIGTSSEAADLLLDYMQDEVGIEALQGFTPEQMDRALTKINTEDLEELGVPDAKEQLAFIRATVKEANRPEEEGNQNGGDKSEAGSS